MQTRIQRPMGSAAAHTWLCQIPVQDASGSEHSEPCGADSPISANVRCELEQLRREGGRRAARISPRPSDTTSHSPALLAQDNQHTSPPCHLLSPSLSFCCAPLFA
ncbi:hypothetical protein NQZ68_029432 [Dissostichus eleginoides]|nr:hypothetical protein NQZ68_029432 [Dissostichus eleginoides]